MTLRFTRAVAASAASCALVLTSSSTATGASPGLAPALAANVASGLGSRIATRVAPDWMSTSMHRGDVSASPSPVTTPSAAFGWPVDPHEVVRRFDPPEVPWGSGHRGVDLRSRPGVEVVAPSDGVVTFSGAVAGRGVLTLHHAEGFDTTYEPVTDQLPKGSVVRRGERIATLAPGHCQPACLHWGYKTGPKSYRDPLTLVQRTLPVLLPPV